MSQRLAGKAALLRAADQGISHATALAFLKEGARGIATGTAQTIDGNWSN